MMEYWCFGTGHVKMSHGEMRNKTGVEWEYVVLCRQNE